MDILPEDAPAPRLCHLIKWPDFDGYGFNLHAERSNPGQFIGKIDDDSPAQMAGLREGDRIVEVNGVNIANENHRQVVERIKSDPQQTRLLVVDVEADNWYRERDQVVKSTQLNVIYMKTPTPRPAPDSPRAKFHQQSAQVSSLSPSTAASSLETSDFNEQDSIEQQQVAASKAATSLATGSVTKLRSSPPMSPDSGKGDEELPATAIPLTIEAEINHQTVPVKQQPQLQHQDESEAATSSSSSSSSSNIIEPDSLSQTGPSMSPSPVATSGQMSSPGEAAGFETRGGSADSGQSSSPDTNSSRGSIADSLEERPSATTDQSSLPAAVAVTAPTTDEKVNESSVARLDADDAQTIKNYQDAETANNLSRSKNNNEESNNETLKTTQDSAQQVGVSGEKLQSPDVEENATEQPLRSALVNSSSNNNNTIKSIISNNNNNNISNNNCEAPQVSAKAELHDDSTSPSHQQLKQTLSTTKNTAGNGLGNNYSGLNLNMTASEMRELIARRKKFDPKKAQMNIRQKYEIIQQM